MKAIKYFPIVATSLKLLCHIRRHLNVREHELGVCDAERGCVCYLNNSLSCVLDSQLKS